MKQSFPKNGLFVMSLPEPFFGVATNFEDKSACPPECQLENLSSLTRLANCYVSTFYAADSTCRGSVEWTFIGQTQGAEITCRHIDERNVEYFRYQVHPLKDLIGTIVVAYVRGRLPQPVTCGLYYSQQDSDTIVYQMKPGAWYDESWENELGGTSMLTVLPQNPFESTTEAPTTESPLDETCGVNQTRMDGIELAIDSETYQDLMWTHIYKDVQHGYSNPGDDCITALEEMLISYHLKGAIEILGGAGAEKGSSTEPQLEAACPLILNTPLCVVLLVVILRYLAL
eukprot:Blabericola_migrator_1__2395@NODE_1672_length_4041_cov_131_172874_g1086_i0_p3_GENE_NODE_1672_length_4041_cov_131_172874_g1086_i0NODE_1672_length_4041_cov_131_172874_g1086_i0_p3_ORF_typecomplete_len286_score27_28_NODE_1672_length_4041_cov_131_172874_g1086_i013692226